MMYSIANKRYACAAKCDTGHWLSSSPTEFALGLSTRAKLACVMCDMRNLAVVAISGRKIFNPIESIEFRITIFNNDRAVDVSSVKYQNGDDESVLGTPRGAKLRVNAADSSKSC